MVARNQTNLFAKYPNLNAANTVGNYTGKLSHKGERVALAMPQFLTSTGSGGPVTNTIYVVQDEVTYGVGGRWGQWAKGGGSSLELINPNTNHRLAYNWADSDETSKSVWTNLEFTGILDNGSTYNGNPISLVQVGLLDVGECLVDNLEVRPGGTSGANIVSNGDFRIRPYGLEPARRSPAFESGNGHRPGRLPEQPILAFALQRQHVDFGRLRSGLAYPDHPCFGPNRYTAAQGSLAPRLA